MKRQNGFSLVEVIVVAVIVGVLAAVGIPIYAGYMRDQRQMTVDNLAETAGATANAYVRRTGDTVITYAKLALYMDTTADGQGQKERRHLKNGIILNP
jgi:prepilin-type N-terminal cleavage/methylation domain-containing protein